MALPMTKATAKSTLTQLVRHWIPIFGLPLTITSDQGSIFLSEQWREFTDANNIKHSTTTPYHPQSNGMVERMHRTLKDSLTACNIRDWSAQLPWVLLQLRNAAADDIDYSPAQITFGGATRRPADMAPSQDSVSVQTFANAITNWQVPSPRPGRWHSASSTKPLKVDKTDYVYVKYGQKRPLRDAYAGPFRVLQWNEKTVNINYQGKPKLVSIDRVKSAHTFAGDFLFHDPIKTDLKLFDDD